MNDTANARRFINSYNKIDSKMRALYNFKPSQSFSDMVRRSAQENSVIRKFEDELMDYARLRNAIVHQSMDGEIIAVPCDSVVEKIEYIEKLLYAPPTNGETMPDKRIVSVDEQMSVKQVLLLVARTNYSNLPVYGGKVMAGIVNNRRLVHEIGKVIDNGRDVDAFLSETPVGDILKESDLLTYYKYLSKADSLQKVLDAFEENKKLLAVVVSEHGIKGERIVNFITAADLTNVHKILEEY